jgi:glycosyltransferase involved in cell wall biosynthesis
MNKRTYDLSIVIPVYNEPENINETLSLIHQTVTTDYEIIVVYDFDEDTTVPILRKLQKKYPRLHPIKNTISRGPSGAIRTGLAKAKGSRVLVTMADLCDDLTQVEQMMQIVPQKAAVACPSRYMTGGEQQLKPSLKVWAPQTAGLLLHAITGLPTVDPTNSYKMYSADLIKKLRLRSTVSFSVTLEIVTKAYVLGYPIVEMPTVWRDRQHGKTNFKFRQSLVSYFPWFCFALLRNRIFHIPPRIIAKFKP